MGKSGPTIHFSVPIFLNCIFEIVATRWHFTKFDFDWGSPTDSLAEFWGPASKGKGKEGREDI